MINFNYMKFSLLTFILLLSLKSFAQNSTLEKITFQTSLPVVSNLYSELKIKDTTAFIIKYSSNSYWTTGSSFDYIVFLSNGNIKRFEGFIPKDANHKSELKRIKIKKEHYDMYWTFLDSCIQNGLFTMSQQNLENNQRPGSTGGKTEMLLVSDGPSYFLGVYQTNRLSMFSTYSPETYINEKFSGYEDRVKFLTIMKGLNRINTKTLHNK